MDFRYVARVCLGCILLILFCNISLKVLAAPDPSSLPIGENPESINSILTPDGYKDISDVHVGDQVIGYDFENNITVTNTLEKIEVVKSSSYLDSLPKQDEDNSESEQTETSFTFYKINNDYELFRDQSVFANRELIHAENLMVGDTLFSDANEAVTIDSIETISTHSEWIKLTVSGNHTYYSDGILLHNASRYWVGGGPSANWNTTGSTNWGSVSNTRNNASVPGTSDIAIFDGIGFGASDSTLSASITINSLDMTGYANTLTHNAVTLTISGNTFKLNPGMVYTLVNASTSAVSFTSTTGTLVLPTAITTNGRTLGNMTLNGTTGYFSLQDDLTLGNVATLTFTMGTFDANNNNVTVGIFTSSNSNTRTLTMGNGIWTLTGNNTTIWATTTSTGLTLNRGNDVVANYSGASGTRTFNVGSSSGSESTSIGFRITAGTDTVATTNDSRIHNFVFDGFTGTFTNSSRTVYGDFIITGSSTGMTLTAGTSITTLAATSGTKLITTSGKTLDFLFNINGLGGTFRPTDDLTLGSSRSLLILNGTLQIPSTTTIVADTITNSGTIVVDAGIATITTNLLINDGTITANGSNFILNLGHHFINNGTTEINSGGFEVNFSESSGPIAALTNMGADLSGGIKWISGALAPNGKIYGMPYSATDILIIDPVLGTATRSDMGADLSGSGKWTGAILGSDGKIYGIPSNATDILIIDPVLGTATRSNMGIDLSGSGKWWGGAAAPNGKIYGVPSTNSDILIIDPSLGTATRSGMGAGIPFGGNKWRGGSLAPNGKIYAPAFGITVNLIIDPSTDTATMSNMGAVLSAGGYFSNAAGANGKIYGLPSEPSDILVINPTAGTATRTAMGASLAGFAKWYGSVLGSDEKIYGMPSFSPDILVIDPTTDTAIRSTLGANLTGSMPQWYGGVLGPDGVIYGIPASSTDILTITISDSGFYNYGNFTKSGGNMSVEGSLFLEAGSAFTAPSGNLTISGSLTHTGGSFNHNSGTVTLDGANQTIFGDTTFNNFDKTISSSDTLTFESGSTQTVEGLITLTGSTGNLLSLRSTDTGIQWIFDPQGLRNITYVDVMDSDNSNALGIAYSTTITYGSNLTNWDTGSATPPSNPSPETDSSDDNGDDNECNDEVGIQPPWLYSAIAQNSSSIILSFTEAADPVEKYDLDYGTKTEEYPIHKEDIDVESKSKISYLIKDLRPNTTYYFRVRGVNGCANGDWSNELSTSTKSVIYSNNLQFIDSTLEPVPASDELGEPSEGSMTKDGTAEAIEGYTVKVKVIDEENKPVEGAKVTIHSEVQEAVTDKEGLAVFESVERGDHRVIIAYNGFEGEQAINLTGDVREFSLDIKIKKQNVIYSPIYLWSVGILAVTTITSLLLHLKRRRS